jgi:lipopolysaccharide assembly outer membrane protein LptD (OstA)
VKLFILGGVVACQFIVFLPQAMSQDNKPAEQKLSQDEPALHLSSRTGSASIKLAAANIQREDPVTPRPSPYASVIRLAGNVEIRTCCVQAVSSKRKPQRQYMVLHADEASYNEETGEIEARGNVRVSFEKPKQY